MPQSTTNAQFSAPAAAAGAAITPSGTAWQYSTPVELIAAADASLALTALVCVTPGAAVTFEVEICIGVSGSETPVARKKGHYADTASCGHGRMPWTIPLNVIPIGQRVSIRMRKAGTSTTDWVWKLQHYKLPIVGDVQFTARPSLVTAPGAALTSIPSNTNAWAYSGWVPILTAGADAVITGLIMPPPFASADYEIDIGVGTDPSILVCSTFASYATHLADGPSFIPLWNQLDFIRAGNVVSVRSRKAGTSGTALSFGFEYVEKPL